MKILKAILLFIIFILVAFTMFFIEIVSGLYDGFLYWYIGRKEDWHSLKTKLR